MILSILSSIPRSLVALTLLAFGGAVASVQAASGPSPDGLWQLQGGKPAARSDRDVFIQARKFQAFTADVAKLRTALAGAPLDKTSAAARGVLSKGAPVEITLPMPRKGNLQRFQVVEVDIMEPGLAAQYPGIKTYRGIGIDDPAAKLALDVTPMGLHAQIMSPSGWVYISPYYFGGVDDLYASYRKQDAVADPDFHWACEFHGVANPRAAAGAERSIVDPQVSFGGSLRTYRLAVAANHQYVATTGGTTATTITEIATIMNRVSAIYEAEVALRLVLIANESAIIYPDAANDPFTGNGTGVISNSTSVISAAVGVGNYDIGHVFTTGSGGISGLGVVCNSSTKGRSTTGLPTPKGDSFSVDYVAHEMGHQFGGNHTFNGGITSAGSCSGSNRSGAHAYEPGSGTSIMAYAGICGVNNDLQPHSDSFFHSESISEILTYTAGNGGTCPVVTQNGNSIPSVDAGPAYTIPVGTPFTLTGTAVDSDGDTLVYAWEERDRGTTQADATAADNGINPIFRSFAPVYSASRTFPKMSDIVNNTTTIGEKLPTVARTALNFRLTVRDNRFNGGATNSADVALTVSAVAGPFVVTSPNTAITAVRGAALPVTWNVANTNLAPVSTSAVNILLSLDGGYTYPVTLASGVANSGAATVTLPAGVSSTTARIKVAAASNVYFDISDANFTIN